jgi:hypothetical protein
MWNPVRPQMGRNTREMMHMMIMEMMVITSVRLSLWWRTWMRQRTKMPIMWRVSDMRNMKKYL